MDTLYREELMDLYKNPTNRGKLNNPSAVATKKNPMCGDELTINLQVDSAGIITDAKFDGIACAVSVISASKLTDQIIGKPILEVKKVTKEKFIEGLDLNLTTSRVKCAELILSALTEALKTYDQKNN